MQRSLLSASLAFLLGASLACGASDDAPLATPVGEPSADTGVSAAATASGSIDVRIRDLRSSAGVVLLRLYRSEQGFTKGSAEDAYQEATLAIRDGLATGSLADVPHGEYALWACHDEDEDGELDTNFFGMPKEGVGVSGPPPAFMPSFDGARFVLDGEPCEQSFAVVYL